MRIAIASYGQETSSFSPVPTTLETYELYGLFEGEQILDRCREVGAIGGFMQTIDAEFDWVPVPIIHGWAGASGPLRATSVIPSLPPGLSTRCISVAAASLLGKVETAHSQTTAS